MRPALKVWDTLLTTLAKHQNKFLRILCDDMLSRLVRTTPQTYAADRSREGFSQWLFHIYTAQSWKRSRDRACLKFSVFMETCLGGTGSIWTINLAKNVIEHPTWGSHYARYNKRILKAMEADPAAYVVPRQDAEDVEAAQSKNNEPSYRLGAMATALDAVADSDDDAGGVPIVLASLNTTLAIRTRKNPWQATPIGSLQ